MNVVFRADASFDIGSGHVMRCLTLAAALRDHGHQCRFLCRQHHGHLLDTIRQRGFALNVLPATNAPANTQHAVSAYAAWLGCCQEDDAAACIDLLTQQSCDWLVVDHYALDSRWESQLRTHCRRLMVIDDLADRPHVCDVLLDQNLGRQPEDYRPWIVESCQLLIGPQYALLRPEFAQWRQASLARRHQHRGQLNRIMVSLGGVDKDNQTLRVLTALNACHLDGIEVVVVMGHTAPHGASIRAYTSQTTYRCQVRVGVDNMAELMAAADLAIGAAGSTTWERCAIGLPTIQLILADNQAKLAHFLAQKEIAAIVDVNRPLALQLQPLLTQMRQTPELLARMSKNAATLTDGGGCLAVVRQLTGN